MKLEVGIMAVLRVLSPQRTSPFLIRTISSEIKVPRPVIFRRGWVLRAVLVRHGSSSADVADPTNGKGG